jgi:hypothetical protein
MLSGMDQMPLQNVKIMLEELIFNKHSNSTM